jgi:ferredoxin-NADP reductase
METHVVKITNIEQVTHDVKRFQFEKPEGYSFIPGQATDVSINSKELKEEKRPFTFTCLNTASYLEFTIKIYAQRNGITNELGKLRRGDELIIRDVWGAINYKGPGIFIAGGAGITPFIAIFRQLYKDGQINGNQLYYSNKTSKDIILKSELDIMLGKNFINTLTSEKNAKYENRRIDETFLMDKIKNFDQKFYVCGPDLFVTDIHKVLTGLGASSETVIIEK